MTALPSFTLLIETANLAEAELASLSRCLDSLAAQTVPIDSAAEVILVDSGDAPKPLLREVQASYPWLTIKSLDPGTSYGDLKASGGDLGTGELVVLADSDVRFEPDWLGHILAPFSERDDVEVVTGETTTPVSGPYSLAIALTFNFPRFSGESELARVRWYWANNAAFRRDLLRRLPLYKGLSLYRGQNIVHCKRLRDAGVTVWRQPLARAVHDLPLASELLSRFRHKGTDAVATRQLVDDPSGRSYFGGAESDGEVGFRDYYLRRARLVLSEDRRRVLLLPLALPVTVAILAAYAVGRIQGRLRPVSRLPEGASTPSGADAVRPVATADPELGQQTSVRDNVRSDD